MQNYFNTILTTGGTPAVGAQVTVVNYPALTPATVYSTNSLSNPITQPILTNNLGYFSFYAPDGHYTLQVAGSGLVNATFNDIMISDTIVSDLPAATIVNPTDQLSVLQAGTQKSATAALIGTGVAGTVTSVGITMPGVFVVAGSPVTTSGTISITYAAQPANQALLGPVNGAAATPTFRALVPADYPVFGASGASHSPGAVPDPGGTAGAINYLREDGTWSVPPGVGGSGTVTSVAMTVPAFFSVSGSPITTSGTFAVTANNASANTVLSGPTSGGAATPGFRALVGADLPVFVASGASHAPGGVPDPGATSGVTHFLREDATWAVPAGGGGATALTGLSDVNVTEGAGIDGFSLNWNNGTSKWIAVNVAGGGGNYTPVVTNPNTRAITNRLGDIIDVEDFASGGADDTTRIQNAFNWLAAGANRGIQFAPQRQYTISTTISFTGGSGSTIIGNNATIKAANTMPSGAGTQMFLWTTCTNINAYDLFLDGNRANRTPSETTNHLWQISTSCASVNLWHCQANNGVCDGFYVNTSTPTTLATLVTDLRMYYCTASNCYRNCMSVINSNRFRDYYGVYTGATGTLPMDGIDFEPNSDTDQGNIDARCYGTRCDGNSGFGVATVHPTTKVQLIGCSCSTNTLGAINVAGGALTIDGFYASGYTSGITRGIVDVAAATTNTLNIRNAWFDNNTTGSDAKPCIYIHPAAGSPHFVENILATNTNAAVVATNQICTIRNIKHYGTNVGNVVTVAGSAAQTVVDGVYSHGATATVYANAINTMIMNCVSVNPTNTGPVILLDTTSTKSTCKNCQVIQTSAIPAGQVGIRFNAVPLVSDGNIASCNGTDFTTANSIVYNAGTSGAAIGFNRP